MKKKKNVLRIIWVIGVYAILLLLLYLVVDYKVRWEDRDSNKYLYFYNCSGDLCTAEEKPQYYYGSVICKNNECPYIKEKYNSYLILKDTNKEYIYDYKTDRIVHNNYATYKLTLDNNFIVSDGKNTYSVIDKQGTVLYKPTDKEIVDYNSGYIVYKSKNKYGIYNETKNLDIKANYEEVKLINDSAYTYLEKGKYYISTYSTQIPINNTKYDYVEPIEKNIILVANDNQIDIIDNTLASKLVMKIKSKYSYTKEEERASLNIKKDNAFIYFNVLDENNGYTTYIYDKKENKLHD